MIPMPRAWLLAGLLLAASGALAAQTPVVHQDIALRLEPAEGLLEAVARVRVEGMDVASFGLAPGYEVSALSVNGEPVPAVADGSHWRVRLGGRPADIELRYHGRLPGLARAPGGEARVFLDAEGGFFPRDAGWYPYFEEGTRYTYSLRVDAPSGQRVAALGKRGSREQDGRRLTEFASEAPVLGIDLMSGPYRVQTREADGVTLRTYFTDALPEDLAQTYLRESARYVAHYADLIGAYPYPDFAVVASPLPVGYGFAGLTYIGERVLALPFIPHTSLPHEILHNWWGNGVYVDYARGNWAEGLTTFMADYGLRERADPDAARAMRAAWLRDYAALPAQRDAPLAEFIARGHEQGAEVIGYHKAAMVFYMLRSRLGEQAFTAALRHFWQTHRLRHAGWPELRRAFEHASGQDLGAYFAHWVERPGAPALEAEVAREGERLRVRLRQQAEAPYPLQVPVELRWTGADGEARRERHVIALEAAQREVELPAPAARGTLAVDPDYELFRRLWPEELPPIVRAVLLAPEVHVELLGTRRERTALGAAAQRIVPGRTAAEAAPGRPTLVLGSRAALDAHLARAGAERPAAVAGQGMARAWMDPDAPARLYVEGEAPEAVAALAQALRHYGNQSYLVWREGRVQERGVWPAPDSRLRVGWR